MGTEQELLEIVKSALPSDKYRDIEFFSHGGTRVCYTARWGPGEGKKVIIKVDKPADTPRGIRHVERGCDTSNDMRRLAAMKEPENHHLATLIDWAEKSRDEVDLSVEPFFEGDSLEKIVGDPLNHNEFKQFGSQLIDCARYMMVDERMFHRDLKPSNLLIKRNGKIDLRVTDLANAAGMESRERKYLPTAGGHFVMDPLLIGKFTGEQRRYSQQSEMFAIGVNLYYALTGKYIFEYEPDANFAKSVATGESLLDSIGMLDREKHNTALEAALKKLPGFARRYPSIFAGYAERYSAIIRKCLTVDEKSRYESIEKLAEDFEKATAPTFYERLATPLGITATAIVTGLTVLASALGTRLEDARKEKKKAEIAAQTYQKALEAEIEELRGRG